MSINNIVDIADKHLDQGLYFGKGKIWRCHEGELKSFAQALTLPLEVIIAALEERLLLIHKKTSDATTKSIVRIDDLAISKSSASTDSGVK